MPGPIDQKLDTFFTIVNTPHNNPAADATQLMNQVFCQDGGANPDWVPRLGITENGSILGPRFLDVAQVQALFTQLFKSFPDLQVTPFGPRTYSSGAPITVGIQTILTGTYEKIWFQHPPPLGTAPVPPPPPAGATPTPDWYSLPLSAIDPGPNPANWKRITMPAAAFFTFDANNNLAALALYMDRYRFTGATQASPADVNRDMTHMLERLSKAKH